MAFLLKIDDCFYGKPQWSDGTPEFNCKMRNLAWEFGRQKRPDMGQFEDLYHALGLGVDCRAEAPPPGGAFTAKDRAPAPKVRTFFCFYIDFDKIDHCRLISIDFY